MMTDSPGWTWVYVMSTPLSVYGHTSFHQCPHHAVSMATPHCVRVHTTFCLCPHLSMAMPHFVCVHTCIWPCLILCVSTPHSVCGHATLASSSSSGPFQEQTGGTVHPGTLHANRQLPAEEKEPLRGLQALVWVSQSSTFFFIEFFF